MRPICQVNKTLFEIDAAAFPGKIEYSFKIDVAAPSAYMQYSFEIGAATFPGKMHNFFNIGAAAPLVSFKIGAAAL